MFSLQSFFRVKPLAFGGPKTSGSRVFFCVESSWESRPSRAIGVSFNSRRRVKSVLWAWKKKPKGFWKVEQKITPSNKKNRIGVTWNLMKSWTYQTLVSSVSKYGNTLGCFGMSRCPFIPLPENWSWHLSKFAAPKQNLRWTSTKNLHARNGKVKFTNHEFKMFMFKFPGCFEHVIFPPCVNNLPCTGGLKFWTCAIYQSVGLSQPRIIQQKTPEKHGNFLPFKIVKARPYAEIAKPSCHKFLKSRSSPPSPFAVGV